MSMWPGSAREATSVTTCGAGSMGHVAIVIWTNRIDHLGLHPLSGREGIFWWPHAYDPHFLGYMAGALFLNTVSNGDAIIL